MSDQIKILHISQALGGVKTHIEQILINIDQTKFKSVVIAPNDVAFEHRCEELGIKYHALTFKRELSVYHDIRVLFKIIKLIKLEKPHIIHTHSAKGGFIGRLAAKMCGRHAIYTPNGLAYLSFTGLKRMIFYSLEKIAKKWTKLFVPVAYSGANRAFFELGYKYDEVEVVLNSVSIPDLLRNDYSSSCHIGMIARLTHQKNPLQYLRVAKILLEKNPSLKFSILGGGLHDHLGDEVKSFIEHNQMGNSVVILPWGDDSTSNTYLKTVDVFVMTSAFEGLPYSLLEAMALGIPSVVSKADGNSDVIQNGENGFSCLSDIEFSYRIEKLLNEEALRKKIGEAGRDYVAIHHNIKSNIKQLESIYHKLI